MYLTFARNAVSPPSFGVVTVSHNIARFSVDWNVDTGYTGE